MGVRAMSVSQLECLVATVQTGSCKDAARVLCVTPQAVSKSLSALEHVVGVRLVTGRGLQSTVTPFAKVLASRAQRVLDDMDGVQKLADVVRNRSLLVDGNGSGGPRLETSQTYSCLFRPLTLGGRHVQNRIMVGPVATPTPSFGGVPSPEYYGFCKTVGLAGPGIVNVGSVAVNPEGAGNVRTLALGSDVHVASFEALAELLHRGGALAACELVYLRDSRGWAADWGGALAAGRPRRLMGLLADAAERLVYAGFDAAFVRADRPGQGFAGRRKFLVDVLVALRDRVGDKLALGLDVGSGEAFSSPAAMERCIARVRACEPFVDFVQLSGKTSASLAPTYATGDASRGTGAFRMSAASRFKKALHVPLVVSGPFDFDTAAQALGDGWADVVTLSRSIYADPACLKKARAGCVRDIRPCLHCNGCAIRTRRHGQGVRCTVNPLLGREMHFATRSARRALRVGIVGGGPAGLQAACTLARLGHTSIVFEKSAELGGALAASSAHSRGRRVVRYRDWLVRHVANSANVDVCLSTEATPDVVAAASCDAVLLAWGRGVPENAGKAFDEAFGMCVRIGDAVGQSRGLRHATQTGFDAAWHLHESGGW